MAVWSHVTALGLLCMLHPLSAIVIGPTHTCLDGWIQTDTTCVKMFYDVDNTMNFSTAQSTCENQPGEATGAWLVEMKDAAYMKWLRELIPRFAGGFFWTGIHNDTTHGTRWITTRGAEVTYFNWGSNQPTFEVALLLRNSDAWFSAPVFEKCYAYCQYNAPAALATHYCADGWKFLNGSCFKYFDEPLTMEGAKLACESIAGVPNTAHLFIPTSIGMTALLTELTSYRNMIVFVWAGVTSPDDGSSYLDIFNKTVDLSFAYKVTVTAGKECLQILTPGLEWFFRDCALPQEYICQYDAPMLSSASGFRDVHWAMSLLVAFFVLALARKNTE